MRINMQINNNKISHIKRAAIAFSVFLSLLFFSLTSSAAIPVEGQTYFTKHNFMFEKKRHLTTNYWRGELVPINSQVEVVSIDKKTMVLKYEGRKITVLNVVKHTRKNIEEIADRMLSTTPVNTSGSYAKSMKFGEIRLGMTKDQVIKTRGYPPTHKTISTESDVWIYWSSRFVQRSLVFENNRLTQGRGLR